MRPQTAQVPAKRSTGNCTSHLDDVDILGIARRAPVRQALPSHPLALSCRQNTWERSKKRRLALPNRRQYEGEFPQKSFCPVPLRSASTKIWPPYQPHLRAHHRRSSNRTRPNTYATISRKDSSGQVTARNQRHHSKAVRAERR